MKYFCCALWLTLAALVAVTKADLPVHCLQKDVLGDWNLYVGPKEMEWPKCGHENPNTNAEMLASEKSLNLLSFDTSAPLQVHLGEEGQASAGAAKGTWTMVYDEAMEVRVNSSRFLSYFHYKCNQGDAAKCKAKISQLHSGTIPGYSSDCDSTWVGWVAYEEGGWSCFRGEKLHRAGRPKSFVVAKHADEKTDVPKLLSAVDGHDLEFSHNTKFFDKYRISSFLHTQQQLLGGLRINKNPYSLPKSFDWREQLDGKWNMPIIDQGPCGSCYVVSAIYVLQSRFRIELLKKGIDYPVHLSAKSAVGCSPYTQGCDGGFPYLVGRYARDRGVVEESSFPYGGDLNECSDDLYEDPDQLVWYAKDHGYVGGFYGATNEQTMMQEIHKNGPITVAIDAEPELQQFTGKKVFKSAWKGDGSKHWEFTNHAVVVVGWGEDDVDGPYWIVRNSWGPNFADEGYVKYRRGSDTGGIEHISVWVSPDLERLSADTNGFEELHPDAVEKKRARLLAQKKGAGRHGFLNQHIVTIQKP